MVSALFDASRSLAGDYIVSFSYPWEALQGCKDFLSRIGARLGGEYREISPQVWVHETAVVAPTAVLFPPCIICAYAEVRHGAFLRGGVLVGEGCVVGNSTEVKNSVLFDGAKVPHFNYVGDSILGYRSHMGAGAITSNVKADESPVVIRGDGKEWQTGLKKCGAFLGDRVEIGCNCVLNPGTVVGRGTSVYPLLSLRGVYPGNSIVKSAEETIPRR